MSKEKAELLPCPFCGGQAKSKISQDEMWAIVECQNDHCAVKQFAYKNMDKAVKLWNTRHNFV